ncbi:hypothetical protein BSKO_01045 [Bryopsis sp. KO-2023]|nr:hypothetical protein BSKO_01045 [Bryopsis sp. KO-2023]
MLIRVSALRKLSRRTQGLSDSLTAVNPVVPLLQFAPIASSAPCPSSSSVGHSQGSPAGLFGQFKFNWGAFGGGSPSAEHAHCSSINDTLNVNEAKAINAEDVSTASVANVVSAEVAVNDEGQDEAFKESLQGVFGVVDKFPSASEKSIVHLLIELGSLFPSSLAVLHFTRSSGKVELHGVHSHLKKLQTGFVGQVSAKSGLNIIKAMALLRYKPTDGMVEAVCGPIEKEVTTLEFSSLVDFVQAMAMLERSPGKALLDTICEIAVDTVQKSLKRNLKEPEEVVHLIDAFAAIGHVHEGFLNAAGDCLRDRIKVLPEESLAKTLKGFARLNFYHEQFLDDIVQECIARQPKSFTPSQLATILHSLSELRHDEIMSEIFVDVSAQCAVRRIDNFSAGEVADLIWAYTRLFRYHSDVKMLDTLTRSLVGKVHQLKGSPDQLVNLVEAVTDSDLGACPEQTKSILSSVEDMTCADIANMSPANIARMLLAFSKARHYSGRLFSGGLKVLADAENHLESQEIVRVLHSCGAMVHAPEGNSLDEWVSKILANEKQLTTSQVSRIVWSLAILDSLEPETFERLCERLGDGSVVQVPDIKRLVLAEMLLDIKCQSKGVASPRIPEPMRSYMVPAWRERVYLSHSISSFQQEVGRLLMKLSIPFELEKLIEEGDCRIDFDLTTKDHAKIAIECDGPRRFSANSPFKPLGDTIASRRILEGRGWNLLSISKHDWCNLSSMGAKEVHLRKMLRKVL